MPAIKPERLKQETAELVAYFSDPARLGYELEALLDRYADRVRRPGQTGTPSPLLAAYKVAPPVMRQIMLTLAPLATADPPAALALADVLWEKPALETHQIAIRLLGSLPADDPAPILARVQAWVQPKEEEHILDELFEKGLTAVQSRHPEPYLEIVREWLSHANVDVQRVGAKALLALAQNPAFDNLPRVFRLLLPRMIDSSPLLRAYLSAVIRVLAGRSPQETAHFLNQVLIVTDNAGTAWITRQAMDLFSEDTQARLKETIRSR